MVEALQSVPVRDATRVRLTLTPAHLGELWIELSVAGSGLRARVRTQTEAARRLILAHLDDLREDLERRGIRIRRFEVDVGDARLPEEEMRKRDGGPGSVRRQVLDLRA